MPQLKKDDLVTRLKHLQDNIQVARSCQDYESTSETGAQARKLASLCLGNSLVDLCRDALEYLNEGPQALLAKRFAAMAEPGEVSIDFGLGSPEDEAEALRIAHAHLILIQSGIEHVHTLGRTVPRQSSNLDALAEVLRIRLSDLQKRCKERTDSRYSHALVCAAKYLLKGACEDLQLIGELAKPPRLGEGPVLIDPDNRPDIDIPMEAPSTKPDVSAGIRLGAVLGACAECGLAETAFALSRL